MLAVGVNQISQFTLGLTLKIRPSFSIFVDGFIS